MAKKELSPEMRVVLAFGLSLLILLISRPLLVRDTPPEEKPATTAESATTEIPATTPEASPEPASSSASTLPPGTLKQGEREETITVVGDLYRVEFSTRGGAVKSWKLNNFKDEEKNQLDLVSEAAAKFGDPLSLWVSDAGVRQEAGRAIYLATSSKGSAQGELKAPVTLTFEFANQRLAVRKQFTFAPDSYVVGVESEVSIGGTPQAHQIAWPGSFGDSHDIQVTGIQAAVAYLENEKVVHVLPKNVEGEEKSVIGAFPFAAIQDHFFTAAFLPNQANQDGQRSLRVSALKSEIKLPTREDPVPAVGLAVGNGAGAANRLRLFVGPKDSRILPGVDASLGPLIDYGWFTVIAKPLYLGLRWIHDNIVANYGWAIILFTVVINLLMIPLKLSSLRSARKMQLIAPQLRAIQDKYKNLKMKDPKRQQMSQETMQLYQKHGVNPVGGCLPMLIQLPFLIGFYNVLRSSIEMRHAAWIAPWITDLSAPEDMAIRLLPLLMCGTQFALQKLTPTPAADPMQQKIMMFMPVMMLFFFWSMSTGLVLYWTTGNLVGIAQQTYFNRTELKSEIEAKQAAKKKRGT